MSTFNTGLQSDLSLARLGKPGGFAPLGTDGKVPYESLPTDIGGGREQLTSDQTFYVDIATGNNTNDGLSTGTAFSTFGKVFSVLQNDLDLNGYKITINVAPGDYTAEGLLHLPTLVSPDPDTCGTIDFVPDGQVIIKSTSGAAATDVIVAGIDLDHSAHYAIKGLEIAGPLKVTRHGVLHIDNIKTSSSISPAILAEDGGKILYSSSLVLSSSTSPVLKATKGGVIDINSAVLAHQIVFSGTYTTGSIEVSSGSVIRLFSEINQTAIPNQNLISEITGAGGSFSSFLLGDNTPINPITYLIVNNKYYGAVSYDNSSSGLVSTDVTSAIDELDFNLDSRTKYIKINHTGSTPNANVDSRNILIGEGVLSQASFSPFGDVLADYSLAIGKSARTKESNAIAIGNNTYAASSCIAIGNSAAVSLFNTTSAISIGSNALVNGNNGIAIGQSVNSGNTRAISIGSSSSATGTDSIAFGNGANSTQNRSIAFHGSATGAASVAIGNLSSSTGASGLSIGTSTTCSGDNGIAIGSGAVCNSAGGIALLGSVNSNSVNSIAIGDFAIAEGSSNIALGGQCRSTSNTVTNSVSLGLSSAARNTYTTALGAGATADNNESVAIGRNSFARADKAFQLGAGQNNTPSTLQFITNTLANAEGLYTSHTAVNYTPADADNVTSHFAAIDIVLGNIPAADPQSSTVNREIITANKTLINSDNIYQHIVSNTASLLVDLPATPVNGTHFLIKNATTSTETFTTNSVAIAPGSIYEVIYDGTEWVVL